MFELATPLFRLDETRASVTKYDFFLIKMSVECCADLCCASAPTSTVRWNSVFDLIRSLTCASSRVVTACKAAS